MARYIFITGGVMSARGAADFLTRATKWSAVLFVALAIVLAAVAVDASGTRTIDDSLDRTVSQPAGSATQGVPSAPSATEQAPAQAPADDPLAGVSE